MAAEELYSSATTEPPIMATTEITRRVQYTGAGTRGYDHMGTGLPRVPMPRPVPAPARVCIPVPARVTRTRAVPYPLILRRGPPRTPCSMHPSCASPVKSTVILHRSTPVSCRSPCSDDHASLPPPAAHDSMESHLGRSIYEIGTPLPISFTPTNPSILRPTATNFMLSAPVMRLASPVKSTVIPPRSTPLFRLSTSSDHHASFRWGTTRS